MRISRSYRNTIASISLALLLPAISSVGLAANTTRIFTLSADEWARPRSGDVIPELDAVRAAVSYWGRDADAILVIRYPGEDTGELWATELRDWLISLGVPSDYIRLVSGVQAADEIKLVVGNRDELEQ
ncbi:MAG: hypothetical protein OEO19_16385 [Gammaproteobacteria bacterium]|nr:hypothetical protein [Gammaproteobacteria bacterium]